MSRAKRLAVRLAAAPTPRPLVIATALFVVCAPCVLVAQTPDGQLVLTDGSRLTASLTAIDEAWNVRGRVDGKDSAWSAARIVQFGRWVEAAKGPLVLLPDDDVLVAADVPLKLDEPLTLFNDKLQFESAAFGQVELPVAAAVAIVLTLPPPGREQDRFLARLRGDVKTDEGKQGDKKSEKPLRTDKLILANGDELPGSVLEVREGRTKIRSESSVAVIENERIAAIVFNPSLVERPKRTGLVATAGFADGSRLTTDRLTVVKSVLTLRIAGGASLKASPDDLAALQPSGGDAVYLSQLKPASFRHVPYLNLVWPHHADRNVLGDRLRAGGALHLRGLGLHSLSLLTYDLPAGYHEFQAELAIDSAAGDRGSVIVNVFTDDGGGEWKPRYASPLLRGGEKPVPVAVDIRGAKRLSLRIDYADRADELDFGDVLGARLVK